MAPSALYSSAIHLKTTVSRRRAMAGFSSNVMVAPCSNGTCALEPIGHAVNPGFVIVL